MNLKKIKKIAEKFLIDEKTGHDWQHALRVERNALKIAPSNLTNSQQECIRAACWLHDVIDEKIANRLSIKEVQKILVQSEATALEIEDILHTIENLSFSKNIEKRKELSQVGEIVQDADRLDALGAIGIARTFYYGGSQGHSLYNLSKIPTSDKLTEKNYRKNGDVVSHFYEKLLRIKDMMNTAAGKLEAEKRTMIMEEFLSDFFDEIE